MLLLLANFGKEGRPEPIIAKISQEPLAEMIGTTRSRVSFFMNKFRELGFIDYNRHTEVHSSLLNVVVHDQPQIKTWPLPTAANGAMSAPVLYPAGPSLRQAPSSCGLGRVSITTNDLNSAGCKRHDGRTSDSGWARLSRRLRRESPGG
jgi:Crp-like helix-turn-helix protein